MAYRIIVKDKSGNKLGEFEKFTGLKFNKRRNNYGSCSFKVPADYPKLNSLYAPRVYECYIYSDDTLVWAGEQASRVANLQADKNNWAEITCYTWLEMFNHRFTAAERIYDVADGTDSGEIAWDQINSSQKQLTGHTTGGVRRRLNVDLTPGAYKHWTNDYGSYFIDFGSPGGRTDYLKFFNFNQMTPFDIPDDAVITGVKVSVKGYQDKGSESNFCYDRYVQLIVGGVVQATNRGEDIDSFLSPDTVKTYGGSLDAWGLTLTPAMVKADDFGVALAYYGSGSIINIDDAYEAQIEVFYAISESTDADLGVTKGVIERTIIRELKYYNQNIMEAIIDMSEMEYGFDFEINDNKVFNVYVQQGSDKTDDIRLEYGVNVESAEIVEDMTNPGNRAIVLGQSFDGADLLRVEKNDIPSQASTKLREYLVNQNDVSDADSLDYLGNAVLRKYKQPVLSINLNLVKNANVTAKDIGLGDVVKTNIHSGIYEIDVDMRINEYSVGVDDDGSEQLSILVSIL